MRIRTPKREKTRGPIRPVSTSGRSKGVTRCRLVYKLETSRRRVEVTFMAFARDDLENLASHVAQIELRKGKRRDLCLVCRSRRSAEAIASFARPMFSGVVWKATPGAQEVSLT